MTLPFFYFIDFLEKILYNIIKKNIKGENNEKNVRSKIYY